MPSGEGTTTAATMLSHQSSITTGSTNSNSPSVVSGSSPAHTDIGLLSLAENADKIDVLEIQRHSIGDVHQSEFRTADENGRDGYALQSLTQNSALSVASMRVTPTLKIKHVKPDKKPRRSAPFDFPTAERFEVMIK